MSEPATRADVRDVADAVRDLAGAMAAGAAAREAQRQEGQARGETVVAQIATHHASTVGTLAELVRRVDALAAAKGGAPYALVYILIAAIMVQAGVVLHLYGQSRGQDATAAFRAATAAAEAVVPSLPSTAAPDETHHD